jgi:hypothetical protein
VEAANRRSAKTEAGTCTLELDDKTCVSVRPTVVTTHNLGYRIHLLEDVHGTDYQVHSSVRCWAVDVIDNKDIDRLSPS